MFVGSEKESAGKAMGSQPPMGVSEFTPTEEGRGDWGQEKRGVFFLGGTS